MTVGKVTAPAPRHRRVRAVSRLRRPVSRPKLPAVASVPLNPRFDEPASHWALGVRVAVVIGISALLWFGIYKLLF